MGSVFLGEQPDHAVLGLDPLEYDRMMEWAFGKKWKDIQKRDIAAVWNTRHRDIYEIHASHGIGQTFYRIKSEWDKFTNKIKIV